MTVHVYVPIYGNEMDKTVLIGLWMMKSTSHLQGGEINKKLLIGCWMVKLTSS